MIRDHAAQMKSAQARDNEDLPEDGEEQATGPGFVARAELRLIDGVIAFFQHWRNRIAPPADDDEDGFRHRARHRAHAEEVREEAAAPVKPRRLRGFLLLVAALLAGGLGGMMFSYSTLSGLLDTQDVLIDDLRDQVGRLQKQDARNINAAARYQQKQEEDDMKLREYRQQIADYAAQIEALQAQVRAAPGRFRPAPAPSAAPRPRPPVPEKTGNCVMGTASAAADLTRCVEQFNR